MWVQIKCLLIFLSFKKIPTHKNCPITVKVFGFKKIISIVQCKEIDIM